jgi:Domain of unknown function (DUF4350)
MKHLARRAAKPVAAAVIGLALLAVVIDGFTPRSSGPPSSSYATSAEGLSAYAGLLSSAGHGVTRLRVLPSRAQLSPDETLVLLDPNLLLPGDLSALRTFVAAGGRLIAGGPDPGAWVSQLILDAPVWSSEGQVSSTPVLPVPETSGVGVVQSAGAGSWSNAGATLPALGEPSSPMLTVATVGAGRISLLADSSPLQNRLLAHADNAALGLALAGTPQRPVVFEEAVHGYGGRTGLAALPARWKWTLIGLVSAALLAVAARIRRLGPPQPAAGPALPPRRAHVEALASALARTEHPGAAAEPAHRHARSLVLRRAGLPANATADAVAAAAARLGLDAAEVQAVAAPTLADGDVLAAGRALAKLAGASA